MKYVVAFVACAVGIATIVLACGSVEQPASCSAFPNDPAFAGSDAWVQSDADPKCCAPVHNQFFCPDDAALDGPTCTFEVVDGGFFRDDTGAGQAFPLGCRVNLNYCYTFYEGAPWSGTCGAGILPDGGTVFGWSFGL